MTVFIIHVMLPFSCSNLNIFALGPVFMVKAQEHVTESYFISAFGYLCLLVGGSLWRFNLGLGLRKIFSRWMEYPTKGSLLLLQSRTRMLLHGAVAAFFLAGILTYYFRAEGFGFNLRGLLLVRPEIRPIAQFTAFYSTLIGSYCLARFALYRERILLLPIAIIVGGLLFFGERSSLLGIAMLVIVGSFIRLGRKLRLIWFATGAFVAVALAMVLDSLRGRSFL